jgi:hypothetical protein
VRLTVRGAALTTLVVALGVPAEGLLSAEESDLSTVCKGDEADNRDEAAGAPERGVSTRTFDLAGVVVADVAGVLVVAIGLVEDEVEVEAVVVAVRWLGERTGAEDFARGLGMAPPVELRTQIRYVGLADSKQGLFARKVYVEASVLSLNQSSSTNSHQF